MILKGLTNKNILFYNQIKIWHEGMTKKQFYRNKKMHCLFYIPPPGS